ncbi:MAG: PTS-dependent dihydroxyacetone kinase operon transcriptional regulator DhaR [Ardenticatenaceae bacterium]|nr:PTS-dependent dihydroxyacetone kinase operon transcriptional regulator DhaR [Ardenticatenaceae bacterium]
MLPTAYPIRQDSLYKYWHSFMTNGHVQAIDDHPLDLVILASWQRCAPLFDPNLRARPKSLNETALSAILKSQADLMTIAIPYMEDVYQFIEGSNNAIILTDGTTCALEVLGDKETVKIVEDYRMGRGSYWSEAYAGTNAVGLALITAMPTQVVGAEHYFKIYHPFVSSAAPIHDANGRIAGIIGIVGPVENACSHTLSLAMATARAITNQLQTNLYLEEANLRLTELNTILEGISEGVLAWNHELKITHINSRASNILRLHPQSILGQSITDIINLPSILLEAIEKNKELDDEEVNFELDGHSANVLINLRTVREGTLNTGFIALLQPIEHVRKLVYQQVGVQASLSFDNVLSQSTEMRSILRQVRIASRGTAPVLLFGEGGVGKTHLARTIHDAGPRANHPFMSINCRTIPRELLISEFLGYDKDEVHESRPSKFELAESGTLLLDHIETLSLEVQAVLVQVIETGHVMRIGSIRPIPVNVRIIATTSDDLATLVADGSFNSHLYYRFGVFNIEIPPLRQRKEDIPVLAEQFLARLSPNKSSAVTIDEDAMRILCRYPWPGNVREFEMVLERAVHLRQDNIIRLVDLPEQVRNGRVVVSHSPKSEPLLTTAEAEREAILRAGWACEGRVKEMAGQLGIGRTTLWRKMKRLNITPDTFKN